MGSIFNDFALVQDENIVTGNDAGETMGQNQGGLAFHQFIQCFLNDGLIFCINRREGFVKNQNFGVTKNRPGNGNSLALSSREFDPFFSY